MPRVEIDQVVLKSVAGALTASSTATVYVYTRGTTTPVTVYQAESGAATYTQPLSVSNGRIEGWVDAGQSLDLVITDAATTYTQPWEAIAATAAITVQDEGVSLPQRGVLNFTGPGVSAADVGGKTTVSVSVVNEYLNIRDYGAVCDFVADDTAAIQAAIDALPVQGGTIVIPGWSKVSKTLNLRGKRGVNLVGYGGKSAGAATKSLIGSYLSSQSCTIDTSTDLITAANHGLSAGDKVTFNTTGTLPTVSPVSGRPSVLLKHHTYWVSATGLTANTFRVSYTQNGTPLDITGTAGTGHTISNPIIDARNTYGFCMRDMQLMAFSASFTGHIIDLSGVQTTSDAAVIERCYIGGTVNSPNAESCVYLEDCYRTNWNAVKFAYANSHVYGMVPGPAAQTNGHNFSGCDFTDHKLCSVRNVRGAYHFGGCVWEPGIGGVCAYLDYTSSGNSNDWINGIGLVFSGCYSEGGVGPQYAFRFGGFGLSVIGGELGGANHLFELGAPNGGLNVANGVSITGAYLHGPNGSADRSDYVVYSNVTNVYYQQHCQIKGNAFATLYINNVPTNKYKNLIGYASAYTPIDNDLQTIGI